MPVTTADVASLLGTLAGVVEKPDELRKDTAAGAMDFLAALLRASLNAGLGVSSEASGASEGASSDLVRGRLGRPAANGVEVTSETCCAAPARALSQGEPQRSEWPECPIVPHVSATVVGTTARLV